MDARSPSSRPRFAAVGNAEAEGAGLGQAELRFAGARERGGDDAFNLDVSLTRRAFVGTNLLNGAAMQLAELIPQWVTLSSPQVTLATELLQHGDSTFALRASRKVILA